MIKEFTHQGTNVTINKVMRGMGEVHVFFTTTCAGVTTTHKVQGRTHHDKTAMHHVLELHFGATILYHGCGIWNFCGL